MLTVQDINNTFTEKGIHIRLPLPGDFLVKNMDILERKSTPEGVGLLLSIRYIDEQGEEASDLFFCEGKLEERHKRKSETAEIKQPPKSELLPHRSTEEFENDDEVNTYLREAISHLLVDKGYHPAEQDGADLYFENEGHAFFLNLAVRCDDTALERAKELAELKQRHGVGHEYALVVPAFQESLGVSLLNHDRWMLRNEEYLAANRIGIYAVDNWNPNLIYAFTIYPKARELKRYFMITGSQWQMVRQRYVANRSLRRREKEI